MRLTVWPQPLAKQPVGGTRDITTTGNARPNAIMIHCTVWRSGLRDSSRVICRGRATSWLTWAITRGMQDIVGRAWASFRKFITKSSLTLIVEPTTEPQQRTDTRMRPLRIGATQPDASDGTWSVSRVHVHVHGILDKACLNTGTGSGRPSCQNRGMLRASRNPIWLDVMYFAEDNRALLLHCASLWMHAWMWTLRQRSRSCELSIFLKLKSIESQTEKKPDPTGRHVLFAGRRSAGLGSVCAH